MTKAYFGQIEPKKLFLFYMWYICRHLLFSSFTSIIEEVGWLSDNHQTSLLSRFILISPLFLKIFLLLKINIWFVVWWEGTLRKKYMFNKLIKSILSIQIEYLWSSSEYVLPFTMVPLFVILSNNLDFKLVGNSIHRTHATFQPEEEVAWILK